jgi:hypothetical protein
MDQVEQNTEDIVEMKVVLSKLNHFTDDIRDLKLAEWKGFVNGKLSLLEKGIIALVIEGVLGLFLLILLALLDKLPA